MDFYSATAKGYDELYGEEQKIKHRIIKENLGIKKNDLLLDVGCGTGIFSCFNCKVIGIDPSMELLRQNKKANKKTNANNAINKIQAIAENLPFRDKAFDKVISVTSMHNFDDIQKGIKEITRVGKRGFAFSILKKSNKFDYIEKIIKKNFDVEKIIDAEKDVVFICRIRIKT